MELKLNVRTVVGLLCVLYLLNLGFGVAEFIPDNIPLIGNLDEGTAVWLAAKLLKVGPYGDD